MDLKDIPFLSFFPGTYRILEKKALDLLLLRYSTNIEGLPRIASNDFYILNYSEIGTPAQKGDVISFFRQDPQRGTRNIFYRAVV